MNPARPEMFRMFSKQRESRERYVIAMNKYFVQIILIGILMNAAGNTHAAPPVPHARKGSAELLAQAKEADQQKYQEFVAHGGKIVETEDGRSFYLLLSPSPDAPIVVSLHGHDAWAFDDYSAWAKELSQKGYGLLALQWWFGQGNSPRDYYSPQELYRLLEQALRKEGLTGRKLLLHGFSRRAANIYGVVALDRRTGNNFFPVIIANSGQAATDFPINQDIDRGKFGSSAFAGTHWVLFCGGKDPNPDQSGCAGMARTKTWIEDKGGRVDLFINDPTAGHGGFHRNPQNVAKALNFFEGFKEKNN